jgi:hypothetical protein
MDINWIVIMFLLNFFWFKKLKPVDDYSSVLLDLRIGVL